MEDNYKSICEDCGTMYSEEDVLSGKVTPCPDCYKCYTDNCSIYACNCGEEAIDGKPS